MKRTMISFLGLASLVATSVGCADGAAGARGPDGQDGSGGQSAETGRELDGTWETACYMKAKTQLVYDDLHLKGTYTEYSDDTCSAAIHVSTWTGSAEVVGDAAVPGAKKINLAF